MRYASDMTIGIYADYTYHKYFKNIVEEFYNIKVDIFKNWKVERTLSRFNNPRRLSKD